MLEAIVDFCYMGCIELTEKNVTKYLAIASCRELVSLGEECWSFLARQLTGDNSAETWMIADKYGNLNLCRRALFLVRESLVKLTIENFQTFNHRLMGEILKSHLSDVTEEFLFEMLMGWLRFNEKERKKYMGSLLAQIRLEFITVKVCFATFFFDICLR